MNCDVSFLHHRKFSTIPKDKLDGRFKHFGYHKVTIFPIRFQYQRPTRGKVSFDLYIIENLPTFMRLGSRLLNMYINSQYFRCFYVIRNVGSLLQLLQVVPKHLFGIIAKINCHRNHLVVGPRNGLFRRSRTLGRALLSEWVCIEVVSVIRRLFAHRTNVFYVGLLIAF